MRRETKEDINFVLLGIVCFDAAFVAFITIEKLLGY